MTSIDTLELNLEGRSLIQRSLSLGSPLIRKYVQIGPHWLFCADAYKLRPLLGWFDIDCLDPQYDFNNSGGGKWRKARGASNQIHADGLSLGFDKSIIHPGQCGSVFVFCHNNQVAELKAYLDARFHRCVQLNWHKPTPPPHRNKNYLADTETYFHAWNRGYSPVGQLGEMNRYIIAPPMRGALKAFGHPTVKPDAVMDKIIANANGETVCDSFMGSGSTGVAAIKAGKLFCGIESNPDYFETAARRVNAAYEERN